MGKTQGSLGGVDNKQAGLLDAQILVNPSRKRGHSTLWAPKSLDTEQLTAPDF